MTRLTPCFAQNWNRVPVRLPMNRLRIARTMRSQPAKRTTIEPNRQQQLVQDCRGVAPISVTPNRLRAVDGAPAA